MRSTSCPHALRILVAAAVIATGLVVVQAAAATTSAGRAAPAPGPVPRATCGPGSLPETQAQGRVPADDVASGRAAKGYRCNTAVVGHLPSGGQFKTLRHVDRRGGECAYYDTPQTHASGPGRLLGVQVVDMSAPSKPRLATVLTTPAMLSPHESLVLHPGRGLLVAIAGTAVTAPGQLDVYDVSTDCQRPVLLSTTPLGLLGHESGFSPDGRTLYASSGGVGTITAVDLTDPGRPAVLAVQDGLAAHGMRLSADGRRLYVSVIASRTPAPGLVVLDVSEVQDRRPNPRIRRVGAVDWVDKSIPQVPVPITVRGRDYVVEVDEYSSEITRYEPAARVGAVRIIDVSNPEKPKQVSSIRLEVHTLAARSGPQQSDPGAGRDMTGYTAHYCEVPRRVDPGLLACSFVRSGLRLFDIRDPQRPREIAYFNPPGGGRAQSAPAFVPERREVWYTDGDSGLWVVRLTNGAW